MSQREKATVACIVLAGLWLAACAIWSNPDDLTRSVVFQAAAIIISALPRKSSEQ